MAYKKIPLEEQLKRASERHRIHPDEYYICAIRIFGDMPLSDYMKDGILRFGMALGVPPERLEKMTVREAAVLISKRRRPGPGVLPHRQLLLLFAAPMDGAYRLWKEAQDAKDAKKEET